jgi:hypothetical protein
MQKAFLFRAKVILQTVLFILIGSFLYSAQSNAQSKEVINPPQKRFEISFGSGWGFYSMTEFNNRMDEVAGYVETIGGRVDIDHIDNGPTIFGEAGYFVSRNVSVNLGVTYLRGAGSSKVNYTMTVFDYRDMASVDTFLVKGSLTTTLVAPELKVKYHFPFEKTDLFLGGGVAWCFGKCVLKSTSGKSLFTAQGVGFLSSTGAWYNLNKTISLGAEVGFRYFVTGDLKDKDKDGERKVPTMGSFTGYKTNLDFSGPFILGGLRLKL